MTCSRNVLLLGLGSLLLILVGCNDLDAPRADTPQVAPQSHLRFEPQGGRTVYDADAEGERAAKLQWQDEKVYFDVDAAPGCYDVYVRVKAELYKNDAPRLRLRSSAEKLGDRAVKREVYQDRAFEELCVEREQRLSAQFINDAYGGSARKDRNVFIDYLSLTTVDTPGDPQGERDPLRQPFTSDSIWNTPVGSNAKHVEANIGAAKNTAADVVHILETDERDPLRQVYVPESWFDKKDKRCKIHEKIDLAFHVPDDYIVPDIGNSPYGKTPNSTMAFVLPDGETVFGGSVARCDEGGAIFVNPYLEWNENIKNAKASLYGDGLDGAGHGATGLSALGGLLRTGELVNDEPISHVVKLMIWGERHLYYDADEATPGYRWPAKNADSYAAETYEGDNPALQMGSLLAVPPSVQEADLQLETKAGRKLFRALQDYGAYITEDPAWDAHAVTVSEDAFLEFEDVYGYTLEDKDTPWARDLNRLVAALHVVDNNRPESIGGGGTPRREPAPPLAKRKP